MSETSLPPAHPLSRFQLLSSPIAVPGKCACCGTATRPVVDFGMTLEFYGAVYFCETCLAEAARAIGFVSPEEIAEVRAGSSQAFNEQLLAQDLVAISRERYNAISMAVASLSYAFLPADDSGADLVAPPAGTDQPTLFEDVSDDDGVFSESESGHSGSSEPIVGEEVSSAVGDSEQDDDPPVSKRSSRVSSRSSNGSKFDL